MIGNGKSTYHQVDVNGAKVRRLHNSSLEYKNLAYLLSFSTFKYASIIALFAHVTRITTISKNKLACATNALAQYSLYSNIHIRRRPRKPQLSHASIFDRSLNGWPMIRVHRIKNAFPYYTHTLEKLIRVVA